VGRVVVARFLAEEVQFPTVDISGERNADRRLDVAAVEFIEQFRRTRERVETPEMREENDVSLLGWCVDFLDHNRDEFLR